MRESRPRRACEHPRPTATAQGCLVGVLGGASVRVCCCSGVSDRSVERAVLMPLPRTGRARQGWVGERKIGGNHGHGPMGKARERYVYSDLATGGVPVVALWSVPSV